MLSLFGRVLGKKNRLRLAYEGDWLQWSPTAQYGDTFPTFEEWLATYQEKSNA